RPKDPRALGRGGARGTQGRLASDGSAHQPAPDRQTAIPCQAPWQRLVAGRPAFFAIPATLSTPPSCRQRDLSVRDVRRIVTLRRAAGGKLEGTRWASSCAPQCIIARRTPIKGIGRRVGA